MLYSVGNYLVYYLPISLTTSPILSFSSSHQEADGDLSDVDESSEHLNRQRSRLAQHYCENEASFNLEEFLTAFRDLHPFDKLSACRGFAGGC